MNRVLDMWASEQDVKEDFASEKSVYMFYKNMLKLRKENKEFQYGDVEVFSKPEDDFFVYTRSLGDSKWVVVCNFETLQNIELPFECETPVLANMNRATASGCYVPYECAAAKVK